MYRQYGGRAHFFVVYIEEAHATDAWQLPVNERQNVLVASARSIGDRSAAAAACIRGLKIEFPALLDGMDNAMERTWSAWPDRMVLLDDQGRVAWKSKPGPWGFRPAEAEAALRRVIASR